MRERERAKGERLGYRVGIIGRGLINFGVCFWILRKEEAACMISF